MDHTSGIAAQAIEQSPCPCYDPDQDDTHPPVTVEPVSNRFWRGWVVTCDRCGSIIAEYDPPEDPEEHRSAR